MVNLMLYWMEGVGTKGCVIFIIYFLVALRVLRLVHLILLVYQLFSIPNQMIMFIIIRVVSALS